MVPVQVRQQAVGRVECVRLIVEADKRRRVLDRPSGPRTPGIGEQAIAAEPKPEGSRSIRGARRPPDLARTQPDRWIRWAPLQDAERQVQIEREGQPVGGADVARHGPTLTRNARA